MAIASKEQVKKLKKAQQDLRVIERELKPFTEDTKPPVYPAKGVWQAERQNNTLYVRKVQ